MYKGSIGEHPLKSFSGPSQITMLLVVSEFGSIRTMEQSTGNACKSRSILLPDSSSPTTAHSLTSTPILERAWLT